MFQYLTDNRQNSINRKGGITEKMLGTYKIKRNKNTIYRWAEQMTSYTTMPIK